MKRKLLVLMTILCVTLSSVACGNSDTTTGESDGQTNKATQASTAKQTTQSTTKATQAPTKKSTVDVHYISNRTTDYDEANDWHRVFWAFSETENGGYVKAPADIKIRIVDDKGTTLYDKSIPVTESDYSEWTNNMWDSSRLLGCVYIKNSDISKGATKTGKLMLSAVLKDGTSFAETTLSIFDLPVKGFNMNLPTLPKSVNENNYNGSVKSTVEVLDITPTFTSYSSGSGSLKVKIKAKMTYNSKGNSSSDYSYVGYKLKNAEGIVVSSGSFLIGPLAVGDVILEEEYISGDFSLNESYTLELIDTK